MEAAIQAELDKLKELIINLDFSNLRYVSRLYSENVLYCLSPEYNHGVYKIIYDRWNYNGMICVNGFFNIFNNTGISLEVKR